MEMMTLDQLASYLHRDARDLSKLANRGKLPGQKVGGEWRFSRTEINHWLEGEMPSYSDQELTLLETGGQRKSHEDALLSSMMDLENIAVPLMASTRKSVLKELVNLTEQSLTVYDAETVLDSLNRREEIASTALPNGVAIPHPHRPLPYAIEDTFIAYGRTTRGIPFGEANGSLTDIYFFVCCQDEDTHVKVMARLVRLLLRPDFIDSLREAETEQETLHVIQAAEGSLVG